MTMTHTDFCAHLVRLELTKARFADAIGVTTRAVERWADGTRPIPTYIAKLLLIADREMIETFRAAA